MVGHVAFNLAPSISLFLKRDINKAFAKVVGEEVNRGCMDMDCMDMDLKSHAYSYHLYGPKPYIDKMKELVDSLTASGLQGRSQLF